MDRTQERLPRSSKQLPDEVIAHHLSNHHARLGALAAQSVHLGIMVEYLVDQLSKILPAFDLDAEEFAEFRERRINEMQAEAVEIDNANKQMAVNLEEAEDQPPSTNWTTSKDD